MNNGENHCPRVGHHEVDPRQSNQVQYYVQPNY